jgi:hypothetical protein
VLLDLDEGALEKGTRDLDGSGCVWVGRLSQSCCTFGSGIGWASLGFRLLGSGVLVLVACCKHMGVRLTLQKVSIGSTVEGRSEANRGEMLK